MDIKNKKLIKYWIDNAENDYRAMLHLFEKGDYTWSLFIGHLVIEKLLKALYVHDLSGAPPFIHDLLRLAEIGHLILDENQKDILDTITTFNIRARYDDYKMDFHKKCSKEFTEIWIKNIKEMKTWIQEKLRK